MITSIQLVRSTETPPYSTPNRLVYSGTRFKDPQITIHQYYVFDPSFKQKSAVLLANTLAISILSDRLLRYMLVFLPSFIFNTFACFGVALFFGLWWITLRLFFSPKLHKSKKLRAPEQWLVSTFVRNTFDSVLMVPAMISVLKELVRTKSILVAWRFVYILARYELEPQLCTKCFPQTEELYV